MAASSTTVEQRKGLALGLVAYLWWGLFPVYIKALSEVPVAEILGHRILWSFVFMTVLLSVLRRWAPVRKVRADRTARRLLLGSTLAIGCNWFGFLYAVVTDQVLQASLGYFINPLVSVVLGYVFLGERLRTMQKMAVLLAAAGVAVLTLGPGGFPWLGLFLAFSFGSYGLLRKMMPVDSLSGLTIETALLSPIAVILLVGEHVEGGTAFLQAGPAIQVLLLLAGFFTTVPLMCFVGAARRLKLATMGIMQFVTPTMQFLLAVVVYGEAFEWYHFAGFAAIWCGLGVYVSDLWKRG